MSVATYEGLLQAGESAGMPPVEHGSQEWAYGYNFAAIAGNTRKQGNSVVLDIEPGGATEPVLIRSKVELTVRVLRGVGRFVLWYPELGNEVVLGELDEDSEPVVLQQGDVYYYLNDGPDNLVLRDDCDPAFVDGDELLLTAKPKPGQEDGRRLKLPVAFWLGFVREMA